jgi:hypothetical protein
MQALIMLKNFITAGLPHAKHQATKATVQSLINCLLDELLASFAYSDNKLQHAHIYQRALQQLAVTLSQEPKIYKHELKLTGTAIIYIREQLPAHFNWNEQAIHTANALQQFGDLSTLVHSLSLKPILIQVVNHLHQLLKTHLCTWRHLFAIEELLELSVAGSLHKTDPLAFVTNYNLYDQVIIQAFLQDYRQQIKEAPSPSETIRRLLKQLNQNAISVDHFCRDAPSLKQQLNDWLSEELFFIETTSPVQHLPQASLSSLPKISTTLSVAQFAAFLRLIMEANIITCSNQRQFLAFIAAHLKTTNANHISAQSFRNKYYGPEINTLSVLKDVCISMLNHARKMSGN